MPGALRSYAKWLHTRWPAGVVEKLPEVDANYRSNVPGLYIVGDLTGIPLLKFSSDSGARAVEHIRGDPRFQQERQSEDDGEVLDVAIVGAGVSGMAAALAAREAGLSFELFEATEPFSTVVNFPRGKPIFTYPTDMVPAGDLQFTAEVKEPLVAELRESVARQRGELAALADDGPGIHTMKIHASVEPLLDDDSAVVLEGADVGFYGAAYLPAVRKDRWFTNGVMGMLGWAIPFGIGAQAALPDSRVVVMAGDGSFGFNGFELDTAVRHRIPVVIVVGNDSVWGIDYHQQVKFFGRSIATELRPGTRYDLVAEALGARGEYVEEAGDVGPALRRALDSDIPSVVNVRTSPSPSPLTRWVLDTKQY